MPDVLVRNVKPETIDYFKRRALEHGRSLQAELRAVMEDIEERDNGSRNDFWEEARRLRDELAAQGRGRLLPDSTDLVREDRDSDHGHDWWLR